MIRLTQTLTACDSPALASVLKRELEQLDAQSLPLQQGLQRGSHVGEEGFTAMVIGVTQDSTRIRAKIGVFFTGIIAGCSCADDPTPIDGHAEYREIRVDIDRSTAEATFTLLPG